MSTNGQIHHAIADHYEGINDALHERDELRSKNRQLENDIAIANGVNKHIQEQLDNVSKERDYYYRKAFAYTNTLVNMRNTMQNMLDLADHEAENSSLAKLPVANNIEQPIYENEIK